jgi:hypothetical protein
MALRSSKTREIFTVDVAWPLGSQTLGTLPGFHGYSQTWPPPCFAPLVEDAMAEDQKIAWRHDFDAAVKDAAAQGRHVLLDFSAAPM